MHCNRFWRFWKTCQFSNIRCFLKGFYAQNNPNVLPESFLTGFLEFQFLTQTEHFAKAIAHAL